MEGQQPIEKFRAGPIACALWENEITMDGQPKTILKASVSRRYKDRNGNWKTSQSFSRNEIPLAIWCLWQAFETMIENPREEIEEAVGAAAGGGRSAVTADHCPLRRAGPHSHMARFSRITSRIL